MFVNTKNLYQSLDKENADSSIYESQKYSDFY